MLNHYAMAMMIATRTDQGELRLTPHERRIAPVRRGWDERPVLYRKPKDV